jgi:hypothetical protein
VVSPPSIKVPPFTTIPVDRPTETIDGKVKVVVRVESVMAMVAPAGTVVPRIEIAGKVVLTGVRETVRLSLELVTRPEGGSFKGIWGTNWMGASDIDCVVTGVMLVGGVRGNGE